MSVNKVILVGRLGDNPSVKVFNNGDKVASFSIATSERWNDKQTGERKEHTEWHRIVLHGRLAEIAEAYLTKGKQVYIEGKLSYRKYQDNQGIDRNITEIKASSLQMLGEVSQANNPPQPNYQQAQTPQGQVNQVPPHQVAPGYNNVQTGGQPMNGYNPAMQPPANAYQMNGYNPAMQANDNDIPF